MPPSEPFNMTVEKGMVLNGHRFGVVLECPRPFEKSMVEIFTFKNRPFGSRLSGTYHYNFESFVRHLFRSCRPGAD